MPDDEPTILDPDAFDREVDELFGRAKKQRQRKNLAIIVACLAVVIASLAAAVALAGEGERDDLARKVQINGNRLDQTSKVLQEQREQFEYCKKAPRNDPKCATPVAPPTPIATPEKPEQPVPVGVTESQVRDIVAAEVARRNLTLTPDQITTVASAAAKLVPKPADGKTPTNAQLQPLVSAAVATFCANDACRGKDGADAPPVTQTQLATTLAAYCEPRNDCIGSDGKNGANGNDGAGIKDVTTTDGPDGVKVTMTFTDGRDPVSFTVLNGKNGTNGTDGKDAFPFTFTFVIPATVTDPERTYTCSVQTPTEPVNCVLQQ